MIEKIIVGLEATMSLLRLKRNGQLLKSEENIKLRKAYDLIEQAIKILKSI